MSTEHPGAAILPEAIVTMADPLPPATPPAEPVRARERVSSVDVLRGVALLGILLMNIVGMGLPHWAYDDPTIAGNRSPIDFWAWAVNAVLFEGKMRTIFSMLIVSPIWLRYFQFGPLEWVWRSLTYRRRQPMRLRAPAPAPAPAVV